MKLARPRGKRSFIRKKKVCRFCVDKVDYIDYKKAEVLVQFVQERGKILPRRITGTCSRASGTVTITITPVNDAPAGVPLRSNTVTRKPRRANA